MIGNNDNEQGPKLVKRPLRKIMINVKGVGDSNPFLTNCSAVRAKSDIARFEKVIAVN